MNIPERTPLGEVAERIALNSIKRHPARLRAYPNNGYTEGMNEPTIERRERKLSPNNRTTTGFCISDELWAELEPLLLKWENTHQYGGGRPQAPDRRCADAIFYVLRTGCQWEALNQTKLCAKSTAHDRFQAWAEAGVFHRLGEVEVERFGG